MDSEDDAGSDSSPSHDAGARRRGECPVLRPARAASATAATSSSVPLAGFPATGWEVKLAMGRWIAWQPGVAFRGEVGEQVEYSWGPYRYIARITSTNSGVQRNVDNGTEHPLRRAIAGTPLDTGTSEQCQLPGALAVDDTAVSGARPMWRGRANHRGSERGRRARQRTISRDVV